MALLNTFQFNNRQVLIFSKDAQGLLVKQQLHLFKDVQTGLHERDIKVTVVENKSILYQEYKVKPDEFTVILVGKDNTEKLRTHKLLLPAQLFAIIDAMPMRKEEMRKQKTP